MNCTPKAVPQIKPDGSLVVCAWCYPGDTVFNDFPWLRYLGAPLSFHTAQERTVTHGICQEHAKEMQILAKITIDYDEAR